MVKVAWRAAKPAISTQAPKPSANYSKEIVSHAGTLLQPPVRRHVSPTFARTTPLQPLTNNAPSILLGASQTEEGVSIHLPTAMPFLEPRQLALKFGPRTEQFLVGTSRSREMVLVACASPMIAPQMG